MRRDRSFITHAERRASRDGYFAPGSVIRRVGDTPVTPLLGGGAAVLLQLAHPLVAAGVAAHSAYDRDIWRRLVRTLRALYLVTYGSREEADNAGRVVQRAHARVRGVTGQQLGVFRAGTPYSATDPALMAWVHATLVHASLHAYQRFEGALTRADQETYYREMTLVARILGTPAKAIPPTLAEFEDSFAAQIEGPEITVTAPARVIARAVLGTPLKGPLRVLNPAHRMATSAHLPARIRDEYGLRATPLQQPLLLAAGHTLRLGAWPVLQVAARLPQRAATTAGTPGPQAASRCPYVPAP